MVVRSGLEDRARRSSVLGGCSPTNAHGVHNTDLINLEKAMAERVLKVKRGGEFVDPPQPTPGIWNRRLMKVRRSILEHIPSTTPFSYQEFLDTYEGRKYARYEVAIQSLGVRPIERRDARLNCFVKAEKVNLAEKPDAVPRLISPRTYRYNAYVGRFIKKLEGSLYHSLERIYGHPVVFKGFNSEKQGRLIAEKWSMFSQPVAISMDASRFDQHVSVDALKWEHSIYNSVFRDSGLEEALTWQLENRFTGFTRAGMVKCTVEGRRCSGDMNTSCGNCLLMVSMVKAFMGDIKHQVVNNGDDCVIITEKSSLQHMLGVEKWFLEMGFTMVVEDPVYELEKVNFCQMHPVCVDGSWLMIRDPCVALSKDCLSVIHRSTSLEMRRWALANGQGGLALCGGVPVFQDFYKMLERNAQGRVGRREVRPLEFEPDTGRALLTKGMARVYQPISDSTRVSFYKAFGILPDVQVCIEKTYANLELDWANQPLAYPEKLGQMMCLDCSLLFDWRLNNLYAL